MIPPRRVAQLSAHETSDFRAAVAATTAIATGIVAATAAPTGTASIKTVAGSVTTTAVFPAAGPGAIAAAFAAGATVPAGGRVAARVTQGVPPSLVSQPTRYSLNRQLGRFMK